MFNFIGEAWDLMVTYRSVTVPVGLVAWVGLFVTTFKAER